MRTTSLLAVVFCLFLFSNCTHRLLDFTVVSSKNTSMQIPGEAKGPRTTGKDVKFLGIGADVKDALDNAIEKEGSEYDALVDGVISMKNYYVASGYEVEGTPINTNKLKAYMGEEEFEKWASKKDLYYKSSEEEASEDNSSDEETEKDS